ncbi:MAG: hypothetical protein M3Q39_05560 [Actinomycetota bacterium]|nr:hypothetical protein [Actinomycetota bacterium]
MTPLVNGEGAIVMGLDGDVLGVEWDPCTADHLQVYKYDGDTRQWLYNGYPTKEAWYYSTDGLNYLDISSKVADQIVTDSRRTYLNPTKRAMNDWIQPNTNGGITPLGRGDALAAPDFPSIDGEWSLLDGDTFRWAAFRYGNGKRRRV